MARLPRLTVPGFVHRLVLRGNNGQAVVLDDEDRLRLLALLQEQAAENAVAVHAWLLLDARIELLATPADERLPGWVQAVGRRYVRGFNDRHGRSGTLFEGRYRCNVLEAETWLLPAMVALDQRPVEEGAAASAEDYAWSSCRHYVGLQSSRLVTPHALCWALGNTPFAREQAYAELVHAGVGAVARTQLEAATLGGWALGGAPFLAALAKKTHRRLSPGSAGRPPLMGSNEKKIPPD